MPLTLRQLGSVIPKSRRAAKGNLPSLSSPQLPQGGHRKSLIRLANISMRPEGQYFLEIPVPAAACRMRAGSPQSYPQVDPKGSCIVNQRLRRGSSSALSDTAPNSPCLLGPSAGDRSPSAGAQCCWAVSLLALSAVLSVSGPRRARSGAGCGQRLGEVGAIS